MRDAQPKTIYLKDYQAPEFFIDTTNLQFILNEDFASVSSQLQFRRNVDASVHSTNLELHGQELLLKTIRLDGLLLSGNDFSITDEKLTVFNVPDKFQLDIEVEIKPQENTSLEGLYKSNTMFCTQCEAEGFRKITYYLDRPDVMSVFNVTVTADKHRYPVLLSNGNHIDSGDNADGSHWVRWEDPFKKPAYLFALVAGDLSYIEDYFTTMNGQEVTLRIYVEPKDLAKCDHAMRSLIHSMKWDEDVYGREYDLNIFNIVAVDDFNMGAMENKSLNIFNTSCVLAQPETTTDVGFQRVEAVVAHEYFHNWSGNRVTCRDWFQLSLKEGFTVYRDAEFSADMGSRTVKRVEDVSLLRTVQFAEDGGPMAHPIRPDSFIEISNFYTVTIYEKGAEVVRMIANLLGPELFRKGSDLYFDRHDGEAVTCEDFVKAMEDASGKDLMLFRNWYSQSGTPQLTIADDYDAGAQTYTLKVEQYCPSTPGQKQKQPFHVPLAMALLGDAGQLPLSLAGQDQHDNTEMVLDITEKYQEFVFENISEKPIPSLLRGFSAPVKLYFDYSRDDLLFLMSNDRDGFCRWDAAQQLGVQVITEMMLAYHAGNTMIIDDRIISAYRSLLADTSLDKAMVALILKLPSEAYITELQEKADPKAIHLARLSARQQIAQALEAELWSVYHDNNHDIEYQASAEQIAARSLKNTALSYLILLETREVFDACVCQFKLSNNMTDVMQAFVALLNSSFGDEKERVLKTFYKRWENESLVINQWFMAQATCSAPETLHHVKRLMTHPAFDIKNPNKVRSLIGAFCGQNPINFHQEDGAGYEFLADQIILLNKLNPQIASRLLVPLTKWKNYASNYADKMKSQLVRIMSQPNLSKDVYEVVSKSLKD